MSRHYPYLHRRGNGFSFRIAVPASLRSAIGGREITKAIPASNIHQAAPIALEFAAHVKRIYCDIRANMAGIDLDKLAAFMRETKMKVRLSVQQDEFDARLDERNAQHRRDIARTTLEAENRLMRELLSAGYGAQPSTIISPAPALLPESAVTPSGPVPTLKQVVGHFLETYPKSQKEMLKKQKPCLPKLVEFLGADKPIDQIKQVEINNFLATIQRFPKYWANEVKRRGLTVLELAKEDRPEDERMAPETYRGSWRASVSAFLCNATSNWEDQGFPAGLSTDKAKYQGTRKEGENKQRAMTAEEMRVLFEGDLMRRHANDPAEVHRFWLPVIGLHTGARVNEICQINPQVDVFKDVKTGAWCMKLTEDTEAGEGIEKTVKNDSSDRTIPVHPKLVELGFIDYVMALRAARVDRIFPAWKPRLSDGRASPAALKAFGDMQRDVGLHGVKNEAGKALRGMHSFRFTLLTYGNEAGVNLECITGHAPVSSSGNESAAGYLDQTILMDMSKKIERLSALDYGLNFPKPVLPATSVKRRYKPRKSAKGNAAEK